MINFSYVFSLFSAVYWLKSLPLHNCFSSMVSHKANAVHEGMKMLAHIASLVTAHIPSEYHQGDKRKQLDEDCDIMHMLITSSQYSFDWFDFLCLWGHFLWDLGSFWLGLSVISAWLWDHFGWGFAVILAGLWGHFGKVLESFWLGF